MTGTIGSKTESFVRVILTIIVLFNAVIPTTALAKPLPLSKSSASPTGSSPNSLPDLKPVYYRPSAPIPTPNRLSSETDEAPPAIPEKDPVEFSISTSKGEIDSDRNIVINVVIRNNSESQISDLVYYDILEKELEFESSTDKLVKHSNGTVTYKIEALIAGEEAGFSYAVRVKNKKTGKLSIHNAEIEYEFNGEMRAQTASMGFADDSPLIAPDALIIVPDQAGDGWETAGRYSLHLNREVLPQEAVVSITPAKIPGRGPELQFDIKLIQTSAPATTIGGELGEQDINLNQTIETMFESPAYLEINLDGVADLENIPAGQEPYVATYDEEHEIWVKVPIVETDPETNSVTVKAAHFSTWGAGLGNSLPQNGANVLLFDQPYTSLFTGASRYSVPIWAPPGRAGMSPDVSLSYSSATVDGVLGDVQAPWVGVGWNIDDIEIVRKITTSDTGYGYINEFALTLNGAAYNLVQDNLHPNKYYTDHDAFLYIERHYYAFGNQQSGNANPPNTTGEWWEVVTTDGTRYRMGWNEDSEQLALMYGYACTTDGLNCLTPDGVYASLEYAGIANDLVAMRWRVDRVTDTHGNYMQYTYQEYHPSGGSTIASFDRESYLDTIAYTGYQNPEHPSSNLSPAYKIHFVYANRSAIGDVPVNFNIWDNQDSQLLDKIEICYLNCTGSGIVRTYDLDYSLASAPNANGTLTLTGIKTSGGGFTENGQSIPTVDAPTIRFTYQNMDNRAVTGTNDKYAYPRLVSIDNGAGGVLTYTYETDNRGTDSWYNYRVKNVRVNSEVGETAALQSYAYTTPVYAGSGGNPNLGALVGYTTTTENQLDYTNSDSVILSTAHTFGTSGLDTGRELKTEWQNGTTIYRRVLNTYVTDNSEAPFSGWNFRYLYSTVQYQLSGGSLVQTAKTITARDAGTGNLLMQMDYVGNSILRKTYYEYLTNPDPSVYILDKASRALLVNGSNQVLGDTRYHYDGKINTAPSTGDLTLTQRLTGQGDDTVDSLIEYDVYGNATSTQAFEGYGAVNMQPNTDPYTTSTAYDSTLETYAVQTTNALLNQSSTTAYIYALGLPYQTTDPNGWVTTTTYDGLGRTLSVQVPGLGQPGVRYTYPQVDESGRITAPYAVEMQILDTPAGRHRSVWGLYDGLGRMLQSQVYDSDKEKALVSDTYFNAQGLVFKQSLPYSSAVGGHYISPSGAQFTESTFDALGRPLTTTQPGEITTTTAYDGLTTTVTDPNGNRASRTTDGIGRLVNVKEYSGASTLYAVTFYSYDAGNRLVLVTDAEGTQSTITYDWLGRKTSMDDPDMGEWIYTYYPSGALRTQRDAREPEQDPNKVTLTFTYDALNRLKTKIGENVNVVYDYDYDYVNTTALNQIGFRTRMTEQSGSTSWSYSDYGRSVTESRTIGGQQPKTMTTQTDWLGRPTSVTYPDDEELTYEYDALGRPKNLSLDQGTTLVDLTYNVLGQVTSQTLGDEVITITNTYDANTNRLSSRTSTGDIINFGYTYDLAGNITGITDGTLTETHEYTYDFLNRLKTAKAYHTGDVSEVKYDQQFDYDQTGNITQMNDWVIPTPLAFQENNSVIAPVVYKPPQLGSSSAHFAAPLRQSGTETPTPSASSVGYWNFDEGTGTTASDSSGNVNHGTVNGAAWTTGKFNGGLSFDGANDRVQIPDSTSLSLDTNQSTFAAWVYADSLDSNWSTVMQRSNAAGTWYEWQIYARASDAPTAYHPVCRMNLSGDDQEVEGDIVLQTNTWYFLACTYDGSDLKFYIDGTLRDTTSVSGGTIPDGGEEVWIGGNDIWNEYFDGVIDEPRIYNRALTESEISDLMAEPTPTPSPTSTPTPTNTPIFTNTPQATPTPTFTSTPTPWLGADTTSSALLHMNGVDGSTTFTDETGKDWTTNGNAQIDTVQSVFGGASALFDGTGDYLTGTDSADFDFTGDFTIDLWFRPNVLGVQVLYDGRPTGVNGLYPTIYTGSDNKVRYYVNSADRIIGTTALTTGSWYHLALTRSGAYTRLFLNGSMEGSVYTDTNSYINGASRPAVGGNGSSLTTNAFNGWIDEVRISKGIARWTSNFTPPNLPYGELPTPTPTSTPAAMGTGVYEDTHASWSYNGFWIAYNGTGYSAGNMHYTNDPTATAGFTFQGPARFTLSFTKSSNYGSFEVWVDGTKLETINAYNPTTLYQQTYTSPFYLSGTHVVTIKNIGSSGQYIDVDAVQISDTPPAVLSVGIYDDNEASWVYSGNWVAYSNPNAGYHGNTKHYSNDLNAVASFTFQGPAKFTLYYTKAADYGSFEVWVDGGKVDTVNAYNASTLYQRIYTSPFFYQSGEHNVQIRKIGSSSQYIDVDAVQISDDTPPTALAAGMYDDGPSWLYNGTWLEYNGTGPYDGTLRYTNDPTATASFTFQGPAKFVFTYLTETNRGSFEVWVDGAKVDTVNAYSATTLWQQTYTSPNYPSGPHTVAIKNISSSGKYIDVDAIQISDTLTSGITDGLKAYWDFEGVTGTTVPDLMAVSNPATLYNGVIIDTTSGQGQSAFFYSANHYASVADHADIKNNGSFTISAWVNPADVVTGRTQYILAKSGDYGIITDTKGQLSLSLGSVTPGTLVGPILPVDTWNLVTGVYDASAGQTRLYLNGELAASQKVTGSMAMGTNPLTFSSSTNPYYGHLDEVRFYNRALTTSEVADVYGLFTPAPAPVGTPTPGFDEYAKSLLHMNGADGSASFADQSGRTWTASGNAQIDLMQSKFGGASALFDGTGDYITTTDSDDFHMDDDDWTIDFWIKFNSTSSAMNLVSQYQDANNWFDIWWGSNSLQVGHYAGGAYTYKFSAPWIPAVNTWYHVTVERNGNMPKIAIGGTFLTVTESTPISGKMASNLNGSFAIGSYNATNSFNGWIDEFRYSKGIARWTANFTPPRQAYYAESSITPTPVATLTPLPMSAQQWGTGNDGNLEVGSTFNINVDTNRYQGRTCADAAAYSVTTLGSTLANLSSSPVGCINSDDEVLLIRLAGGWANDYNPGSYEFLRVSSVVNNQVTFATPKTRWYGVNWRSDSNIGTGSGQIRVMLMRVPNYNNVTVTGTLSANPFDGYKYGVVVFRVAGELTGDGAILADKLGFRGSEGYGQGYEGGHGYRYPGGGGGGSYGTVGAGGNAGINGSDPGGWPGSVYGTQPLDRIYLGSGGGAGGTTSNQNGGTNPGTPGYPGGGIVLFSGKTINFTGSVTAKGWKATNTSGGGGSGGSIRIEGETVSITSITATGGYQAGGVYGAGGSGGVGRVAVYYSSGLPSVGSNPQAYTAMLGQAPTPTPTSTPINLTPTPVNLWGTGRDGNFTVSSGTTFNINASSNPSRTCADGASYTIKTLTESTAQLTEYPGIDCLAAGDEILILHLKGSGPNTAKYEFLRVGGVVGDVVYFLTTKVNNYGSNADSDTGVGTTQTILLQRVPNYNNLTVNGTLTSSAFNGSKYGVLAFRVAGTMNGSGAIHTNTLGFRSAEGYGKGYNGSPAWTRFGHGGGGGYGTAGTAGQSFSDGGGAGGAGGTTYGVQTLDRIYLGSGGGLSGYGTNGGGSGPGNPGAPAGGLIFVMGQTISYTGSLASNGGAGFSGGGSGSGGSMRIEGNAVTLNSVTVNGGGSGAGSGGKGRIAVYYHTSLTSNLTANSYTYLQQVDPNATPTPTPTPTVTSTPGFDGYVVSLLHMDRAAAPTVFTDETGKTWTASGDAKTDTAQSKLGNASALFDGTGDYITTADSDDFHMGSGDWTIDFWVRFDSVATVNLVSQYQDANNWFDIWRSSTDNRLYVAHYAEGANTYRFSAPWTPVTNTWYHVTVERNGNTPKIAVNGGFLTVTESTAISGKTASNLTGSFVIGAYNGSNPLDGWIDEFRYSKGIARWTANFTPPNEAYYGTYAAPTPTAMPTAEWVEKEYTYSEDAPHAVTALTDAETSATLGLYEYDENGNMTCRIENNVTYKQVYNTENRISSIQKIAAGNCDSVTRIEAQWDFAYDGDGTRTATLTTPYDSSGLPISAQTELTVYYFGGAYEVSGAGEVDVEENGFTFASSPTTIKKYYSFNGQTIAMNDGTGLQYFLTDHLGSVVAITDASGTLTSQQRYLPFGGTRANVTTPGDPATDYGYTGQRTLDEDMGGLMDYKARFYSSYINHFIQPDTIIPDPSNPQAWNRYSYVGNNPIRFNDPTGHMRDESGCRTIGCDKYTPPPKKTTPSTGGGCTSLACLTGGSGNVFNTSNWLLPTLDLSPTISPIFPTTCGASYCFPISTDNIPREKNSSYGAYSGELITFWENFGSPIFLGVEMDEVYQASKRGGWKLVKWSIPSGPFEAVVGGIKQGYRDSWTQNLNPSQRTFRIGTAAIEALLVDGASTLAGATGFEVGGPIGYLGGSIVVSVGGENFFHDTLNPWLFPNFGMGVY